MGASGKLKAYAQTSRLTSTLIESQRTGKEKKRVVFLIAWHIPLNADSQNIQAASLEVFGAC